MQNIMQDLDALMDENAATESELNLELRETLKAKLKEVGPELDQARKVIEAY